MKLIVEQVEEVKFLTEEKDGKKTFHIEGVFMQAEKQNKNGRVYPFKVLNNEVQRYNNEYVMKNRAFGELSHPCFWEHTKALTQTGFKKISDIVKGELVYQINPYTNKTELLPVKEVIKVRHTGKMYHIKNRNFETHVTGDHKFLMKDRYGQMFFKTVNEIYQNADSHDSIIRNLPSFSKDSNDVKIDNLEIPYNNFMRFMGIWLSEGHCTKRKDRNDQYIVGITQNVGKKSDIIDNLLENMREFGMNFSKRTTNNKNSWTCHNRSLGRYLSQFGKAHEKYLHDDLKTQLNFEAARDFLYFYNLGDGRLKKNQEYRDVFTTSERMANDLQLVASVAGFGIGTRTHIQKTDRLIEGRVIRKENIRPLHFVKILHSQGIYTDPRHMKIIEYDYDDYVYCLKTDHANFMAMDCDYSFITGNCGPQINLDRVSHMITKLVPDGNNFIGKAKILDTPMGNIVRGLLDSGASLGVSTRGVGSLKPVNGYQLVQDDFKLATAADIVHEPSAPDAWVSSILENREWIFENGNWREADHEKARKTIRMVSKARLEEVSLQLFKKYMSKL